MGRRGSTQDTPPGGRPVLRSFVDGILIRVRSAEEIADETLLPVEQVQSILSELDERDLVTEIAPGKYAINDDGLEALGSKADTE